MLGCPIIEKLNVINFLFKFDRFQVIKFRLVGLDLSKISIIEVSRILEWAAVPENYDSTRFVSNCKIFPRAIKSYSCQGVLLSNTELVSFSKAIYVDPLRRITLSILMLYR